MSLQLYIRSDSDRRIHSYSIPIPKSILKFGMANVQISRQRPVFGRQRLLLHFTRVRAHAGTSVPPRPDARAPSGSCARMHAGPCTPASIPPSLHTFLTPRPCLHLPPLPTRMHGTPPATAGGARCNMCNIRSLLQPKHMQHTSETLAKHLKTLEKHVCSHCKTYVTSR